MSDVLIQPAIARRRPFSQPRTRPLTPPAYCHHKGKGLAYVRLNEEFIYLGAYGSEESKEQYGRIIAEWMATGRTPKQAAEAAGPSINEVLLGYWRFAEGYYASGNGDRKGELERIAYAIKPLKELYGTTPAANFGPLALKAVRQKLIDAKLCRTTINQRVGCIKRIFKWAASEELVSPGVYHGLQSVDGLRRGRSAAREAQPVRPVPDAHVDTVLPFLPPTVAAMVRLHRLTGMRSGELCLLRTCDVDTSGAEGDHLVLRGNSPVANMPAGRLPNGGAIRTGASHATCTDLRLARALRSGCEPENGTRDAAHKLLALAYVRTGEGYALCPRRSPQALGTW